MRHVLWVLALLALFVPLSTGWAQEHPPLALGSPLPDFSLPGVDGKTYTPANFKKAKLLVIVFTCNHCPTAQAYEQRLMDLDARYRSRGVALVAVNPNNPQAVSPNEMGYSDLGDSLPEMKVRARQRGFKFPYLYDGETQKFAIEMGVLATPHVFIFDRDRKLRYQGSVDDAQEEPKVTKHSARDAIEALLADQPVAVPTTRVFGCSTKWKEKAVHAQADVEAMDARPVELKTPTMDELKALMKNDSQKWCVINFWATWCAPCVAELPDFEATRRFYANRPVEVVTISLDGPAHAAAALDLLRRDHISCDNYLAPVTDANALAEALDPKWPGPVPYTLIVAPGGRVVYRHTGELDPVKLREAILEQTGREFIIR